MRLWRVQGWQIRVFRQVLREPLALLSHVGEAGDGDQGDGVSVRLDFDLFAPTDLAVDSEEVWERLDAFRVRKNEVFEACITDHTRNLIA